MAERIFAPAVLAGLFLLAGCSDNQPEPETGRMPLVVDGWIEEGEAPVVIVTRALDLSDGNGAQIDGIVERWGRVSVFDGDEQYILTGRKNSGYTPSFLFTSSRLRGKSGHTYRLLVETETDTVEATATMLAPARIIHVQPEIVTDNYGDAGFGLRVFADGIESGKYYRLMTRTYPQESRFYGAFLGAFSGDGYDSDEGRLLTRGVHTVFDGDDAATGHYFAEGDRVEVKIYSLEPDVWAFWEMYDRNVSLSENIFFTFGENCPTNIKGGLGCWGAYGCSRASVVVRRPD